MMTRRSSELLIIRLPAACMVAGTALISVLSARGSCPEGQGCPLVGGARVRGGYIADQDAPRQRARGTCRADLAIFRSKAQKRAGGVACSSADPCCFRPACVGPSTERLRTTALSGYKLVALSAPEDRRA